LLFFLLLLLFRLELFFFFLLSDLLYRAPIGFSVLTTLINSFVKAMTVSIDCETFFISKEASITIGYRLWDRRIDSWDLQVRVGGRRSITLHINNPRGWRVIRNTKCHS